MKLHLGCGNIHMKGYLNVDIHSSKADEFWDCTEPLKYAEKSCEEIVMYHFFEHIPIHKTVAVVQSWRKCLIKGGKLIIEVPDFDGIVNWYLKTGSYESLEWIFGNQKSPGQNHYWGWNKKRLKEFFEVFDFEVTFTEPQDYHRLEAPCLRAEMTRL